MSWRVRAAASAARGHQLHERGPRSSNPLPSAGCPAECPVHGPPELARPARASQRTQPRPEGSREPRLEPDNDRHPPTDLRGERMPTQETARRPSTRRQASRTPSKRRVALPGGASKAPTSRPGGRGRARASQALARKTQARVPREPRHGVRRPHVEPKASALARCWEEAPGRPPNGRCWRPRRYRGLRPPARTSNRAAGNRTRAADHSRHHLPAGNQRAARQRHDKHRDATPPAHRGSLLAFATSDIGRAWCFLAGEAAANSGVVGGGELLSAVEIRPFRGSGGRSPGRLVSYRLGAARSLSV